MKMPVRRYFPTKLPPDMFGLELRNCSRPTGYAALCGELTQALERTGARATNLNPRAHARRPRPFPALA